jgi:predicted RNase H-like HicB family nuclease
MKETYIHMISSLDVVVGPDPAGGFYSVVPALPGCGSQGDTVADALENVNDAIMTVLDVLREDDPNRLLRLCGAMTQCDAFDAEESGADSTATITTMIAGKFSNDVAA